MKENWSLYAAAIRCFEICLINEKIEDYILNYQIFTSFFMREERIMHLWFWTKRKNDAFPNENVPNAYGKKCKLWLLVTLDRLIYLEELFQVLKLY
jgi:hypothetical protein